MKMSAVRVKPAYSEPMQEPELIERVTAAYPDRELSEVLIEIGIVDGVIPQLIPPWLRIFVRTLQAAAPTRRRKSRAEPDEN